MFENTTKEVIKSRKSKKDRQYNDHKKNYRRTNNDLQNTTQKIEDRRPRTTLQPRGELKCSERVNFTAPHVDIICYHGSLDRGLPLTTKLLNQCFV